MLHILDIAQNIDFSEFEKSGQHRIKTGAIPINQLFSFFIVQICSNFLEDEEEQRLKKRRAIIDRATAPVVPSVYKNAEISSRGKEPKRDII